MQPIKLQVEQIEPSGTREKILFESAKLFARQGYVGTSTREITEAVGISQPGLYRHFSSKEEIILALGDAILNTFVDIISGVFRGVGDIKDRIEYVVEVSLRSVIRNSSSINLTLSLSRRRVR